MSKLEMLQRENWDVLERDVLERIRILRAMCFGLKPGDSGELIARDVIEPHVRMLAEFCASFELDE